MMSWPQLRIRTEFSFRSAYGSPAAIAEHLKSIGCDFAACVDTKGTWGHVQWEKALLAEGIEPGFGVEIEIADGEKRPRCWVLAANLRQFYRISSNPPRTEEDMKGLTGVIRFSGAALTDPDAFDYVDLNPRSISQCLRGLEMARELNKPFVLTSDNDYPAEWDAEAFLIWDDSKKMTPQWILAEDALREAFWFLSDEDVEEGIANARKVAESLRGLRLEAAPMISVDGDLWALIMEGKEARLAAGHIAEWTEEYEARLRREYDMIVKKNYMSYFIVVADLVAWAKTKMLVGPARGSSAGSLVCFLLAITEVDPLPHDLIFERFIDINRDDLPDIDIDFNDKKRHLVFDYLAEKYGAENVAKIGNVNRMKPRSVMAHAGKKLGIPHGATFAVLNVLIEHSSGDARYGHGLQDTLEITKPGQEFCERYPEAEVMGVLENHASHTGVHAAGIIVSNEPVVEFCTVRDGVAQIDKKDAEYLNLLKIDALGLRTLGVIEDAGVIEPRALYDLSLDDPDVFRIFNDHKFSGIFQFEGAAQRNVSEQINIDSFKRIDHITALARPGPLGGGAAHSYIDRAAGREQITYRHPSMADYLSDTMGVVLYQEQVMRIVREIGQFSWEETSVIRKAMSGRKGEEFFNRKGEQFRKGALAQGIDDETAAKIWEEICSFGAWGMNKSHTTSYAMISYWCAYMKRHFPVEYAAACLRSAKDDEQTLEILRELVTEGVGYEPFDPLVSEMNWVARNGKVIGGFMNVVGIGPAKAQKWIEKRDRDGLSEAEVEQLRALPVKPDDLWPAKTLWKDMYERPWDYNVHGDIKEIADLKEGENGVVICKLIRKDRRDRNEQVLIAKRGGERATGQTLFLDIHVVDDSVSKPVRFRIGERYWHEFGEKIADRAVDNKDWFLVRGRWLDQFSMMIVKKIKCLTNPEVLT